MNAPSEYVFAGFVVHVVGARARAVEAVLVVHAENVEKRPPGNVCMLMMVNPTRLLLEQGDFMYL